MITNNTEYFVNYFDIYKELKRHATREENYEILRTIKLQESSKRGKDARVHQGMLNRAMDIFNNNFAYQEFIEKVKIEENKRKEQERKALETKQREINKKNKAIEEAQKQKRQVEDDLARVAREKSKIQQQWDWARKQTAKEERNRIRAENDKREAEKEKNRALKELKESRERTKKALIKASYFLVPFLVIITGAGIWFHQTVGFFNEAPYGRSDYAKTRVKRSVVINALNNDMDPDGSSIKVEEVFPPNNGIVVLDHQENMVYQPAFGFEGTDTFYYVVTDGKRVSSKIMVKVEVIKNESPVPGQDRARIKEMHTANINVLNNDYDADDNLLKVVHVSPPKNGTASIKNASTVTYTPNKGFSGDESFVYYVSDGSDTTSAYVIVTIEKNIAPDAEADKIFTRSGRATGIHVLGNDYDENGDKLVIVAVKQPRNGIVNFDKERQTIQYVSHEGYGGTDSFYYTLSDGIATSTGLVTVDVRANQAPRVVNDTYTLKEGTSSMRMDVLANDSDPERDQITIYNVTQPKHGAVRIDKVNQSLTYEPEPSYSGSTSFSYTVSDGAATTMGSVSIRLMKNQPPKAINDVFTIKASTSPTRLDVLRNDSDPERNTFTIINVKKTGSLRGELSNKNSSILYTHPHPFYDGAGNFSYTVRDSYGNTARAHAELHVKYDGLQCEGSYGFESVEFIVSKNNRLNGTFSNLLSSINLIGKGSVNGREMVIEAEKSSPALDECIRWWGKEACGVNIEFIVKNNSLYAQTSSWLTGGSSYPKIGSCHYN